jgi:hypothetical protein
MAPPNGRKPPRSPEEWAELLDSREVLTRRVAARRLLEMGSQAAPAAASLIALLRDSDPEVRFSAQRALRSIAPSALPSQAATALEKYLIPFILSVRADPNFLATHGPAQPSWEWDNNLATENVLEDYASWVAATELEHLGEHAHPAVPAILDRLAPSLDARTSIAFEKLLDAVGVAGLPHYSAAAQSGTLSLAACYVCVARMRKLGSSDSAGLQALESRMASLQRDG